MRFDIEKPQTRRGHSYVLQSSILKKAIEDSAMDCNVHLVYWTPQQIGSILEAHYWLPNENVHYDRFYIRAGVVNSEDRAKAKALMIEVAIPELVRRMTFIKSLPQGSTLLKNGPFFFNAIYRNGTLTMEG